MAAHHVPLSLDGDRVCSIEQNWDHERDSRKHDFPLRLEREISTPEEIAVALRDLKSVTQGAHLIEQYVLRRIGIALDQENTRRVERAAVELESLGRRK